MLAFLLAFAVVGMLPTAAFSALLNPGSAIIAAGDLAPVGGSVIAGGVPVPFVAPTFSGTLTTSVISGDVSNPWGGLTFTFLLHNNGANSIGRLTLNDFAGFLTDVSYQTPLIGQAPTFVDRSGSGDIIGFNFIPAPIGIGSLGAGADSALLVVQTNALAYRTSIASVIDGTVASVATFAPVPEPSSLMLFTLGASAMLLAWRKRGWRIVN